MIHAKLFMQMQRLSYVLWLLAASLVLGWAGEATAQVQDLTVYVEPIYVREDGGAQDITVVIETKTGVSEKDLQVQAIFDNTSPVSDYLNDLFTISPATILLKKGEKKATGTITITPIDNDRIGATPATGGIDIDEKIFDIVDRKSPGNSFGRPISGLINDAIGKVPNLADNDNNNRHILNGPNTPIILAFDRGKGYTPIKETADQYLRGSFPTISYPTRFSTSTSTFSHPADKLFVELIDDEQLPTKIQLSFDPYKLSKQADATSIEVTATLMGGSLKDANLTTRLVASSKDLTRDEHYTISGLGELTIPRGQISATTTITLDPNGTKAGVLEIKPSSDTDTLTAVIDKRTHMGKDVRIDANGDGTLDKNDFAIPSGTTVKETLDGSGSDSQSETAFGVDINSDGKTDGTIAAGTRLIERTLGIDFYADGDYLDVYEVPAGGLLEAGLKIAKAGTPTVLDSTVGRIDFDGDGDFDGTHTTGTLKYVTSFAYPVKVSGRPITIEDVAIARVKSFTLSPATIRENAGATDITMTVELETALTKAQRVDFEITPGEGTRDEHYTVQVTEGLTIPAGDTKGTATLRVTPVDNSDKNAARTFTVKAKIGDEATQMKDEEFTITDDETLSENITLKVSPSEIKEDAGATTVTVTGTLNGKVLDADATITLSVDETPDKSAVRDLDYTAALRSLTIPQGEVAGSTRITVTPVDDGTGDNDETITLKSLTDNLKNQDGDKITVGSVAIKLKDPAATTTTTTTTTTAPATSTGPTFGADALAFEATVGRAFSATLPVATGGQGTLSYKVSSDLPAGLSFDSATRTISGTPTMTGLSSVVYMAFDDDESGGIKTFTITVSEPPPVTVGVTSVMASQSAVRENGETAEIRVTATLSEAAPAAEAVRFTIVPPASGAMATRDVDYTAALVGTITIAAGDRTGSMTLFLSPIDNDEVDGHKYLGIRAAASGGWSQADLRISDDETASTAVVVSVMPSQLSESADLTEVQVMVALDGKPLADDATATVSIDEDSPAVRDTDYLVLFNPRITIAAGSIAGSTRLLVDPVADDMAEGDEAIRIKATLPGLAEGSATLVLTETDGAMMDGEEEMMIPLAFGAGASIAAQSYTAGTAIHALELPAAVGGEGAITYSVSDLPAGLSFDAATRMISGTPEAEGSMEVTYTAMAGDESASLMFTITINPMLDFGDLSALFGGGAGKRVPLQAGLNTDARLYLDAPTALPSVGEEFVLDVRLADFVAVRGYGLQVAYDADKLEFVRALTESDRTWAVPQVLAEAGVLTVVAHGETVADGELGLRLVFRPTTEIASTTLEITDNQTYDRALGVNRLALPTPVALQTRPAVFSLADNYPNPFNPTTTLQYALPQAADVALTVYNVLGQPVRTLVAERQNAGRYVVEWDATNDQGHRLSAGMYFYRLQAGGDFREVKKMLLLK